MDRGTPKIQRKCCMKSLPLRTIVISALAISVAATLQAQPQSNLNLRAPATPLVVHDPYFSIWSDADRLTGGPTRHWTVRDRRSLASFAIDGKNYRYLGESEDEIPALEETQRTITPTRTIVTLGNPQIELQICFFTPAFADDMAVMARPVTLSYMAMNRVMAHNTTSRSIWTWTARSQRTPRERRSSGRVIGSTASICSVSARRSSRCSRSSATTSGSTGDTSISVAGRPGQGQCCAATVRPPSNFSESGEIPTQDDLEQPRMPRSQHPASPKLIVTMPLGCVGIEPVSRHVLLSYDDFTRWNTCGRGCCPTGANNSSLSARCSKLRTSIMCR